MAEEQETRLSANAEPDGCTFSLLGRRAPAGMEVRLVSIPGHGELAYKPADWAGSLVVVEEGEIEIECRSGCSACFGAGSVLFFDGLRLHAVRNTGGEAALLSAVSRPERVPDVGGDQTDAGWIDV